MENCEKFFEVNINKYVSGKNFSVWRPASLNNPKNHAVMFITKEFMQYAHVLEKVQDCLVFWPQDIELPQVIANAHAVVICKNPHREYCRFYKDNRIRHLPPIEEYELSKGAYIGKGAVIGGGCHIFPGVYVSGQTIIGNNVYLGAGVKLVGRVKVGDNVVIRENSVIGADGLSTDRDEDGIALTMPQFGGVILESDVQIGALTVVARGAIDDTVIKRGSKIDNSSFISHNVCIGEDTFVVGETIMFGSSSTGDKVCVSGNSTIRNGVHIGSGALIGMGSVVVKSVAEQTVVKGNPAK